MLRPLPLEVDIVLRLKIDGTVVGWGWNFFGQATGVRSDPSKDGSDKASGLVTIDGQVLSNVTAVAAGRMQSVAVKNDGTIVIWGLMRWDARLIRREI